MTIDQFFLWEQASRDTLDFKKAYVDMAGDLLAGLVLSEIVYWYLPAENGKNKLRVERDGSFWIAVKRYEWWERIRVTPKQADRAIAILVAAGLIEKHIYKFSGDPTVHVRIVEENFLTLWTKTLESKPENPYNPQGKTNSPVEENDIDEKVKTNSPVGKNVIDESAKSLTEITTETTTEITERALAGASGPLDDPFGFFPLSEDPEAKACEPEVGKEKQGKGSAAGGAKTQRTKEDLFLIAQAISEVTGMDFERNRGRLFREAKLYAVEDVETIRAVYGKAGKRKGSWYSQDWRGKRGEMPTPDLIRETWGKYAPKQQDPVRIGPIKKINGVIVTPELEAAIALLSGGDVQ